MLGHLAKARSVVRGKQMTSCRDKDTKPVSVSRPPPLFLWLPNESSPGLTLGQQLFNDSLIKA